MKRFGIRLLTAVAASSMIVTPVMAAPSVDDLESDKAAAQSEVTSLQAQLTDLLTKIRDLEADLISKGEEVIQAQADLEQTQQATFAKAHECPAGDNHQQDHHRFEDGQQDLNQFR